MVTIIKKGMHKKEIYSLLERHKKKSSKKKINLEKYCGVIELKEDALEIQKKLRYEWE